MAKKVKKVVKVRREREDFGGFFIGSVILGLVADFYLVSWPIGTLVGLGVGFILISLAKLLKR